MERMIIISTKERKRIARLFGVSKNYLSEILHYKKNGFKAREIRQYCIGTMHATVMEEKPP